MHPDLSKVSRGPQHIVIPDDVLIAPPLSHLPERITAFFGTTGKWWGTWRSPQVKGGYDAVLIIERLREVEAGVVYIVPDYPPWYIKSNIWRTRARIERREAEHGRRLSLLMPYEPLKTTMECWFEGNEFKGIMYGRFMKQVIRLLSYCLDPTSQPIAGTRDRCTNDFERDVYDLINARGYRIIPQFEVAGYSIDFVIESEQKRLAVECDGDRWHRSSEQRERDMRRQRVLERCGWSFWRARGSEFYFDPQRVLESLWKTLEEHHIFPPERRSTPQSVNAQVKRATPVVNISDRVAHRAANPRLKKRT